jgi:hypothetical protein
MCPRLQGGILKKVISNWEAMIPLLFSMMQILTKQQFARTKVEWAQTHKLVSMPSGS